MMKKSNARGCASGRPAGFTLIEVLVTLLILSVGLLGLAGLQTRGLKDNHSSMLRTHAVQWAEDMLDRMRANRAAALDGDYDIVLDVPGQDRSDRSALNSALSGAYTGIVLDDLAEWKFALARALPAGDGSVTISGNIATVVVQWSESAGDQTVSAVTRL